MTQLWGITQIRKKGCATLAPRLAPEAAHHIAVGAETLALRWNASATTPGLPSFSMLMTRCATSTIPGSRIIPSIERRRQLFRHAGAIFSFELDPSVDLVALLNRFKIIINSTNLGDNRTLAIPVAHTIYFEMGAERRASMGIADR